MAEEHSCNSNEKDCMLSICEECKSHGLEQNNFNKRNDETYENDGDISNTLIAMEMIMQYANIISGKREQMGI